MPVMARYFEAPAPGHCRRASEAHWKARGPGLTSGLVTRRPGLKPAAGGCGRRDRDRDRDSDRRDRDLDRDRAVTDGAPAAGPGPSQPRPRQRPGPGPAGSLAGSDPPFSDSPSQPESR
jgi:hypothetical protein